MKILTFLFAYFFYINIFADIAPSPIVVKSINTNAVCNVQMVRENVTIYLYPDSSFVECVFYMKNHGDSITLPIGFPAMHFFHHNPFYIYEESDKNRFKVQINNTLIEDEQIYIPPRLDSIFTLYKKAKKTDSILEAMYLRKRDSIDKIYGIKRKSEYSVKYPSREIYDSTKEIYDDLYKWKNSLYLDYEEDKGNYPTLSNKYWNVLWKELYVEIEKGNYIWYLWDTRFATGEEKVIKVSYFIPSGIGYGGIHRYIKYLLSTGANWQGVIEDAQIKVVLQGVNPKYIEDISPTNYQYDAKKREIIWHFRDLKPTEKDDIYVQYYNPTERKKAIKEKKKRERRYRK